MLAILLCLGSGDWDQHGDIGDWEGRFLRGTVPAGAGVGAAVGAWAPVVLSRLSSAALLVVLPASAVSSLRPMVFVGLSERADGGW